MKIKFLGSSHGVPASDRYWSSTMIEINGSLYFIDAGAPVIDLVLRDGKHPNNIRAVFTTHKHGDHTAGLVGLCDICAWYFKESNFDIFLTEPGHDEKIISLVSFMENDLVVDRSRLRFKLAHEGCVYEDENIKISYIKTQHIAVSYAILVEAEGKKILFSGDMSWMMLKEDFPVYALENHTDLVVCELAHFGLDKIEKYMDALKTDRLWFNHVFPLEKFAEIASLKESKKYPYEIHIVKDADFLSL